MTVWLGASLDKVYICLVLYIDHLIKLDIRTSCDDILDHPSHHGHIVYRKVCMYASIHSKWCRSLSKRMSVFSSHLDSSCPHISSHSNSLSIEVPRTRWFPTDCLLHNISWSLHTHWSCSCHNVHSHSGRTNPTWLWVSLDPTHSYNSQ